VRYPDGGGLTAAEQARREAVRLQAAGLFASGWSGPQVAAKLRVSRTSAWRCQPAWKRGGAKALLSTGSAGPCRLDATQIATLARTDTLDLLAHVQFGSVEVDHFPGEPEHLPLAQTHDEDQGARLGSD
jgi:putative transposase